MCVYKPQLINLHPPNSPITDVLELFPNSLGISPVVTIQYKLYYPENCLSEITNHRRPASTVTLRPSCLYLGLAAFTRYTGLGPPSVAAGLGAVWGWLITSTVCRLYPIPQL